MRHRKRGRKLGRNSSHRKALMRNMANSLLAYERIVTTSEKAKEARPFVERLITIAKKGLTKKDENRGAYVHAYRRVMAQLQDKQVVQKLFGEGDWREATGIAERFLDRPGGYTRILPLSGSRMGGLSGGTSGVRELEFTMPGITPEPLERKLRLVGSNLGDNSSRVMFELVEALGAREEAPESAKPEVKPEAEPSQEDQAAGADEDQAEDSQAGDADENPSDQEGDK